MTYQERCQNAFLGFVVGDALGCGYENLPPNAISFDSGYFKGNPVLGTIPGQVSDDSEMMFILMQSVLETGKFDSGHVFSKYREWFKSSPVDCGETIRGAFFGKKNERSQSNGCLMKNYFIPVFFNHLPDKEIFAIGVQEADLFHSYPECLNAAGWFCVFVANLLRTGSFDSSWEAAKKLWNFSWDENILNDYTLNSGYYMLALENAVAVAKRAVSFQGGILETVKKGGDTDTNAAIAGIVLGAMHSIPQEWADFVLKTRAMRPEKFLPEYNFKLLQNFLQDGEEKVDKEF